MAVRVLQYSDVENAFDRPERIGRLAGLIDDLRGPETAVVGTGDNTAPGVLSIVSAGRQALEFYSRVEPDLETPGNHDFDHGLEATRGLVADSPQTWLAANVYRRDGDRRADPDEGCEPGRFGADVGAVPVEAVGGAAAGLRSRGADGVVVLSHVGRGDEEIARETDVDAVLGGHLHSPRLDRVAGTPLARPGVNARRLVELRLDGGEWTAVHHDVADAPVDAEVASALRDRFAAARTSASRTAAGSGVVRRSPDP